MESADSHHFLHDQPVGFASSLATPCCYGLGSVAQAWTAPSILNTNGFSSSDPNETILMSSRETRLQENSQILSSQYSPMAPNMGFHWDDNTTRVNFASTTQSGQDVQLPRIKEELADHYYRKYSDILLSSSTPPNTDDLSLIRKNEQGNLHPNDIGTKLLLKSFSSGNVTNKIQLQPGDFYSNINGAANCGRVGFSQILPGISVSNLNPLVSTNPVCSGMNMEALDLLASSRFSGNFGPSPRCEFGLLRDCFSYGFDHLQQSHQIPLYSSGKVSTSSNGAAEAKRSSSSIKMEPKSSIQNPPKKSRLEARASCPPFKVRKEKLGDRIAALQQLVAPFGKTDTASVLMEAIGYIKFLQSQVETLSVPYMKASRNKSSKAAIKGDPADVAKPDLKSRGLCLVPLSYITDGGGAVVWPPPPHFGGDSG